MPLPGTGMFKDAITAGYKLPTTLKGWASRKTKARFEERDDVSWYKNDMLKEYIKIENDEFGTDYKKTFERERTGEYVSPMHGT